MNEKLANLPHPPFLRVELVPRSCHFSNLRSNLRAKDWNLLRLTCYEAAGYVCEICGGRGWKHPVECHEIWQYDDQTFTQILKGLIALCPSCHHVKHMALAREKGWDAQAERHFCKVNDWPFDQMRTYMDAVFEIYEERSQSNWNLDISWLKEKGIVIPDILDR